jgi:hypothetical protein
MSLSDHPFLARQPGSSVIFRSVCPVRKGGSETQKGGLLIQKGSSSLQRRCSRHAVTFSGDRLLSVGSAYSPARPGAQSALASCSYDYWSGSFSTAYVTRRDALRPPHGSTKPKSSRNKLTTRSRGLVRFRVDTRNRRFDAKPATHSFCVDRLFRYLPVGYSTARFFANSRIG